MSKYPYTVEHRSGSGVTLTIENAEQEKRVRRTLDSGQWSLVNQAKAVDPLEEAARAQGLAWV